MKKELKKGDVYIVVDTPKKAKKLKKVLNMFGEKIYSEPNHEDDDHNGINMYWGYGFSGGEWQGVNTNFAGHCMNIFKEVSIKELRNILAREHLKEGDVVITKSGNDEIIAICNKICKPNIALFEAKKWYRVTDGYLWDNKGCFDNFLRYATEAEKELLRVNSLKEQAKGVIEPVSEELEVGKWYFVDRGYSIEHRSLVLFQGHGVRTYGFSHSSDWTSIYGCDDTFKNNSYKYSEATPKEVEKALIEEAKKRYNVGDKIYFKEDLITCELDFKNLYFISKENTLYCSYDNWSGTCLIFNNGKWAEVIKNDDKFAELKEAYKNGAEIQFYDEKRNKWFYSRVPCWDPNTKYRIKPEEKPQVGDLVKAWDNDERDFVIGKLNDIDDSIYPFTVVSAGFKNAKKITPQEAKELLTDYCR